jgi:NAD(P)-dependent dehydrogenase (short-subunit alcohol dehydrogenase family)
MTDPGRLVLTGGSGTVGNCLLDHLTPIWPGRLCALGRARPARLPAGHDFIACDLANTADITEATDRIVGGPPVAALVCVAGVDCRAGLDEVTAAAFAVSMQVNCLAHLRLLRAAARTRPPAATPVCVVLVSNDVVGAPQPTTLIYAAAKAAAEEAFRHAAADIPPPGMALLTVRLPDIGVPMRTAAGPPPPPRTGQHGCCGPPPKQSPSTSPPPTPTTPPAPRRSGMRDWTISTSGADPVPARHVAEETHLPLSRPAGSPGTYLVSGSDQPRIAACAETALHAGHRVVLLPGDPTGPLPSGTGVHIANRRVHAGPYIGHGARPGWDLAMFSSGSTTGAPRGYGFTHAQLDHVNAWYEQIYQVTKDSIIVTALPATYNFTFVAGVLLAARLGARLHLSRTHHQVLHDARQLAGAADRLIVLANPIALEQADITGPMPPNVLVDSGGAPLSTTAVLEYRERGIDLREGYGLTETASLTHFDVEGSIASAGTVGTGMPGVRTSLDTVARKPCILVSGPAIGIPLDHNEPEPARLLHSTDVGAIDAAGRLRLLGRFDDEPIGGFWPRDTLDMLGPLLHRRCALIRHTAGQAVIKLLDKATREFAAAIQLRAAEALDIPLEHVSVTAQDDMRLLHSVKMPRPTTLGS